MKSVRSEEKKKVVTNINRSEKIEQKGEYFVRGRVLSVFFEMRF